jgi:hypothetical protein
MPSNFLIAGRRSTLLKTYSLARMQSFEPTDMRSEAVELTIVK